VPVCELWFETFMAVTEVAVRGLNADYITKKCCDSQKTAHIIHTWSCICNRPNGANEQFIVGRFILSYLLCLELNIFSVTLNIAHDNLNVLFVISCSILVGEREEMRPFG
jgi:hypothetical protein